MPNVLSQFLELPPQERRLSLGSPRTLDALAALGTDAAVSWLEKHIESPVGIEWGRALHHVKPNWQHLERWIGLTKQHCLAAVDALLMFSAADSPWKDVEPELPSGAEPKLINSALDVALANHGNPRLEKASKQIRQVWPAKPKRQRPVSVPPALTEVAQLLFREDSNLMADWHQTLSRARERPNKARDIYESLLAFGEKRNLIAIVDWRAPADEIVTRLNSLGSLGSVVSLDALAKFVGENTDLFRAINNESRLHGQMLVSFDHGCDDYPVTFLPSELVRKARTLLASFGDAEMSLVSFE